MSSTTQGYFRPGDSWLHRRHPLTKLLALFLVILAAFLLPALALPVLAVVCLLAAWSVGLGGALIRALRIPAVLITSILVVNTLFFPGASDFLVRLGPVGVSREGLAFGLQSAGRILVAFMASVLFLFTTLADDMLEALVARGVNHRLAFVVLSAVQMVPRLRARADSILDAQQARGLDTSGSLPRRIRALLPLVAPVLLGSLIDVRERTFALEARGFGARPARTAYREVVDPPGDRVLRILLLLGFVAVIVMAIANPFHL